jgi:kinesin family protein 22
MAATHKVKIAARLRPRLDGEIIDDQIQVNHNSDTSGGSTSSTAGGSYISVTNPRDQSQVFKFPCVYDLLPEGEC